MRVHLYFPGRAPSVPMSRCRGVVPGAAWAANTSTGRPCGVPLGMWRRSPGRLQVYVGGREGIATFVQVQQLDKVSAGFLKRVQFGAGHRQPCRVLFVLHTGLGALVTGPH